MKRYIYIGAFVFLGLLVTQIIHALLEIPILAYLTARLEMDPNDALWAAWPAVHKIGGLGLSTAGVLAGYFLGRRFWQILYVEKRYGTPRW